MSKHAYLIIAHDEFWLLQKLITMLDDVRNDIYIHIDKKVKSRPQLFTELSELFFVKNNVDVRWGHVSQIKSEYVLFENSYFHDTYYERYHLISGTHLPLKSQHELHLLFESLKGKEVLSYVTPESDELDFKVARYHFLVRNHKHRYWLIRSTAQILWRLLLQLQYKFNIRKHFPPLSQKASNWVSLTPTAVSYILTQKQHVLEMFRSSFCGDELFIPYLLEKCPKKLDIIDEKRLLFNEFEGSSPRVIKESDFRPMAESNFFFARKFSSSNKRVIDKVITHLNR